MDEEAKKLEAAGDGLRLACARLYFRDRHGDVPYSLYTRLITLMVNNRTLAEIALAEGIYEGRDGAAISTLPRKPGEYPDEKERLMKIIRSAIRGVMKMEKQSVTARSIEIAAKQIVAHLRNG